MSWINNFSYLDDQSLRIIPLERNYFDEIIALSKDKRIWLNYAVDGSDTSKMYMSLEAALSERSKGTQFPMVIQRAEDDKVMGCTRFIDIHEEHKKLEIGWTWLHPDFWGLGINTRCKFLLLSYCFVNLGACRVQFKTDVNNIRSRKAIEKIGAQQEGIFRNDMIRDNGTNRNSAYYSIISADWEVVKRNLVNLIAGK